MVGGGGLGGRGGVMQVGFMGIEALFTTAFPTLFLSFLNVTKTL